MVVGEEALCSVCCEHVTERPGGCRDRRCISLFSVGLLCIALFCTALFCIVLYCIVLFCAVVPVVIGEALCKVCCEPVTEILQAAVADIVLYCIVLYCILLYCCWWVFVAVVLLFVLFSLVVCFLLRKGPGGDW